MNAAQKLYPLNEKWDLSPLLPGAAGAETYAEKDAVIQSLMGKHAQEIARFNRYIAEWNDGTQPFDFDRLHDMVDYLHVLRTHTSNVRQWIDLHQHMDGESPEVQAHTAFCQAAMNGIQAAYGALYVPVVNVVVGNQELFQEQHPVLLRSVMQLLSAESEGYPAIPMITGIQYSKNDMNPYDEYKALFKASEGFQKISDDQRVQLAEILTKSAQDAWGVFAARGTLSTEDLLWNYEANFGIPKQLMSDLTDPQVGFPRNDPPHTDHPDMVSWEETQLALRKVFSQFPGGEAMLDHALSEGWICSSKRDGAIAQGYSLQASQGLREWTGSHSYIYMPFDGSAFAASSIAHELGHALQQELTSLYNPAQYLQNLAFVETFAIVAERMMDRALLEVVQEPERQVQLADVLTNRAERVVSGFAHATRVANDVMKGVVSDGRTTPYRQDEIEAIIARRAKEIYQEDRVYKTDPCLSNPTLYQPSYGPAQVNSYCVAALAAQGWADRYFSLPEAERKEMAAEWVEVMKDAPRHEKDMAGAMSRVGVDIAVPGFTERCVASMKEWRRQVEVGATDIPAGKFSANENARRTQERTAQVGRR